MAEGPPTGRVSAKPVWEDHCRAGLTPKPGADEDAAKDVLGPPRRRPEFSRRTSPAYFSSSILRVSTRPGLTSR